MNVRLSATQKIEMCAPQFLFLNFKFQKAMFIAKKTEHENQIIDTV